MLTFRTSDVILTTFGSRLTPGLAKEGYGPTWTRMLALVERVQWWWRGVIVLSRDFV